MFSRFILVVACVGAVLVFMNEEYATVLHTGCFWHPCGHSIGQKQAKGREDFFWFSFKASHSIMMGEGMAGCMVTGVRSEGSSQGMDQDAEIGDRTRDAENP